MNWQTGVMDHPPLPKDDPNKFSKYRFGDDPGGLDIADQRQPDRTFIPPDGRLIVVVGDGVFAATGPGQLPAPVKPWYRHLKVISKRLGVFPPTHALAGQRRVLVLKGLINYF